jgi:hypothetical protein
LLPYLPDETFPPNPMMPPPDEPPWDALAPPPVMPERIPAILKDGGSIETRWYDLLGPLTDHFEGVRLLARYSKQLKVNWFPDASVSAPSVMLSNIRAVEKTAIAYLAGGKPNWKVSSYGGYQGQAQQDEQRGKKDAKLERVARAIWHHIDRQSSHSLAYEPVERAVRQGEVILQFGWIPEQQRLQGDPGYVPQMADPMVSAGDVASFATPPRRRFPVYVRVLNRLKVVYELDPFGEPIEVYHRYRSRASQLAELFPEWEDADNYDPFDEINVCEAYIGAYWTVTVDEKLIFPARRHHYGPRPPFVISQCAPEEVWSETATDEGRVEARVGMPFAYDVLNPFQEACIAASLKRAILENAGIGTLVIENSHESRRRPDGAQGEGDNKLVIGPATALLLIGDEKLVKPPVAELPGALGSYLEDSNQGIEILTFSTKLLMGDTGGGDSSGYAVEQMRQAAMARLLPYRDAISRAWSRLFEKIFVMLSENWAPEWGQEVTLTGQMEGVFFQEQVTPEDLSPPPDTVEMTLVPAVPQNKIGEEQARNSSVQAGTMDVLVAMEERGSPSPQEEYNSMIVHKAQMEIPELMMGAVQAIIQERMARAGQMPPPGVGAMGGQLPQGPVAGPGMPPGGGVPGGALGGPAGPPGGVGNVMPFGPRLGPQPPQPPPMGPRPLPTDPRAMQGPPQRMPPGPRTGSRGPRPQQRPAAMPLGTQGTPNMPLPINTKRRP